MSAVYDFYVNSGRIQLAGFSWQFSVGSWQVLVLDYSEIFKQTKQTDNRKLPAAN